MKELVDFVLQPYSPGWHQRAEELLRSLLDGGRYPKSSLKHLKVRSPAFSDVEAAPFAALINADTTDSGAYGGASFVIFPAEEGPAVVSLVVGTQGLSPDEDVLGRPGHARKVRAIAAWLNSTYGGGSQIAWAKENPTYIDVPMPEMDMSWLGAGCAAALKKYGHVIYGALRSSDRRATEAGLTAFLDLLLDEHGQSPLSAHRPGAEEVRNGYFGFLLPQLTEAEVVRLLQSRRYVVLEGPPGTGKTRMALRIKDDAYEGRGRTIQFHPNTTYESFVGGLAPVAGQGMLQFAPRAGHLMEAIELAEHAGGAPVLLHIDEINRADLSKVLGEAIFLFESDDAGQREVQLEHDFGESGRRLRLPPNLHVLGTMNSADRSIAILDIAVRRRFAFVQLWPQMAVVEASASPLMLRAFEKLLDVFVEHASDESFPLMPGHSYFLAEDEGHAKERLRTSLAPLLREYLAQGYTAGFSDQLRSYLQWLESVS